ncbi:MAG: CYTH domain-containing protein [Butyrivibrio sp.]|nr:CYTH domain-containing protein [Butyrivibrio sp.]
MGVEIERKFTVRHLPEDLDKYPYHVIEQGYLNVSPAIRVRREDDSYYMTYKNKSTYASKGHEALTQPQCSQVNLHSAGEDHEAPAQSQTIGATEYNLPLDKASYEHMLTKADGNIIRKKRYLLPLNTDGFTEADAKKLQIDISSLKIELDVFDAPYDGTIIAEVEFPSEEAAAAYKPAYWFNQDVTGDKRYSNAQMSLRQ